MIRRARYEEDFQQIYQCDKRKIIVYGAGNELKRVYKKIPNIHFICDKRAGEIGAFGKIPVYEPSKLEYVNEAIYIIVCAYAVDQYEEICNEIKKYDINAIVFHSSNNIAFGDSFWETEQTYRVVENQKALKVNIVCADQSWIFGKFAKRMADILLKENVNVSISNDTREDVDINHHIPYVAYKPYSNDTLMITHVDSGKKLALLKKQLECAAMGICMSCETMNRLIACGIPRGKICYINPAQDNVIKPHKYVIGITYKCRDSEDLRKRTSTIIDMLDGVNPAYFKFFIMGSGWEATVHSMLQKGFEVEYYPDFIYDTYNALMQTIDYFLYMGFDEGAMGYLDALAAGAGTIVTPQGYHLDTNCPIDYPCNTVRQFREAFLDLQRKKEERVNAVAEWTWESYAKKHLEIWNYLLSRTDLKELYRNQSFYMDGIFSMMIEDNRL